LFIQSKNFISNLLSFFKKLSFRKREKAFSIVERETAPLLANKQLYLDKKNLSLIGISI